ncbi:hypothetical protein AYJ54_22015 [Bradyrhizobium centrolobii]|uniref:Uncharacterized protein n=2 Tax=Bradyrhizobium centrolobii TaxID=1505087 RepID=A0A176YER7_9BRAD|nr:hypothetical protein AYJ54_22015 [Bradyrhizobium centrolobii]
MRITLVSSLSWYKEIKGWNYFTNTTTVDIGTTPGLQTSALITKPKPTAGCFTGTDTIILCKAMGAGFMTGLYCFDPIEFWDFWGGYDVTFNWFSDNLGSGVWGAETPEPTYPLVRLPDGTLMEEVDLSGGGFTRFSVVYGGASFAIDDPNAIPALGLDRNNAIQEQRLPSLPADSTLVRELHAKEIYVVFGGAKFLINQKKFNAFNQVHLIPHGGTNQLRRIPYDGTLIKEEHDPRIYFVNKQHLHWIVDQAAWEAGCFASRNVRTVPDGALAEFGRGHDITA